MAAACRLLLPRSLSAASRSLLLRGNNLTGIQRYGTAAAFEEQPITPPVKPDYTKLLINGIFVDSASGKTFPAFGPRTREVIAHVAEANAEDVNNAVAAARKAFDEGPWPRMNAYERSRIMFRFADLIEKHDDEIAAPETWDNGKPYEQSAQTEIPMLAHLIRYYADKVRIRFLMEKGLTGWADKIHGLIVPADSPHHVQVLHEPIRIAGQIIPWNFPMLLFAWKIGPALACENTVVLKTAEQTPLSALYVSELLYEAGLPEGVLNVVSGFGPAAGTAIASNMEVDKVAFTGSTDTGKIILGLAAKSNPKPVTLELGGKSPMIIMDDDDVDQAVEVAHFALIFNQGQCCCAGSRTFVHESIYDEFVEKAKARALKRVVGDPFRKDVEQGPQDDVAIAKDEIFGPVQTILKFNDLDEVIKRANNSRYGLAAGFFTSNIDKANTVARALKVGTMWVNCFDVFDAAIPFGGYKMSGHGREKGIDSLKS